MTTSKPTTRQRLVQAALDLFVQQGITETTTRQIAEQAGVNEVTLFRNFGSKHGLLLGVMQETDAIAQLGRRWAAEAEQPQPIESALYRYAEDYLDTTDRLREFLRSLVGEAGQYPLENRQAIAAGLNQVHRITEQYLATVMARDGLTSSQPVGTLASLLNTLLMGYVVLELTTEFHHLWPSRQAFLQTIASVLQSSLQATTSSPLAYPSAPVPPPMQDLPAPLVRTILQTAQKAGPQDYAIAYVLFGAGLSPQEVISLQRIHSLSNSQQHLLQIPYSNRQVPLNQWIMGHRYGSYQKNPLTQWLKSRKDHEPALFINEAGQPLPELELRLRWQALTANIITPTGQPPAITQAQHTWRVEMLMRGIDLQALVWLTGCSLEQLTPYQQQAQARLAIEQALRLDQKTSKGDADKA